ncbi:hypothetical protein BDF19DRAFT_144039 [Syncephalis fuscata]|nr:hypothetical protein BDF19DRAFT_144039 [Syncephalis fuscata]
MFSKAIRAACYRELQVDVVNRHSRLELRNLHYHAASGQCVRPPSAAVLINSSSSATFGTDLAVTTCTGCMLYRLTQQTGAPLPSRLFLFIAWKITTGSHSCWLEVLEANYDAFPADKNELRRHFNQITMETSGEERGVLQRNILLPGDICFSVAAVMGDTKKTNMRIELYNGVFDTGSQLVTAPLVLMPFEEDEVFHLDPLKVTEQLPTHQEVAAALEQQLPTVMFYSEHNKVRLIDPFFNLQKGSLHSMPTNTTLFNGSFCQYLLQPANGRARGSMIYSLVAASSTSDAIFLASYMPITMYILVGWDVNINGCSRFYMDVVCTDSDLRIDEVIRRRVFSFALKEFERSNNDPTMIIGRRKFTGELLGVPFSISAYVRSPHPHSVFLEFTEDIGYRTLLKPVWLPSRNDFNHQTLTGAQQVAREKELSCLIGSVRQNTPRIIILVENTHPQVVLEQCDSGLYINSFNQSIIPRKIAPGEIVVATSQVNIENRIFSGHIIYKVHNAYTSTQSVNPPSSALSFIANHRDRNSSSPGRSSGKRFSVARAFKAAKSALSTRDTVVPESPISHIFLIINWAIVAGRQRLLFSAEYIATNNADFNDTSKAQNRYMLLVLTALTRSEQGNRMVHWAHASNGNEQPSERPKTSSRSSVVAESKMQLDPTLAVDSHMSLETIPVLSLGVRQSPVTTNQKPPVEYTRAISLLMADTIRLLVMPTCLILQFSRFTLLPVNSALH